MIYAPLIVLLLAALALIAWCVVVLRRKAARQQLMRAPFPDEWCDILRETVLPYKHLKRDERNRLHGLINVFLGEKSFEGCAGLELTDEMTVTIAAEACLLVLHRPTNFYKGLKSILVYPSTYVAGADGLFTRGRDKSVRLGESWTTGAVVLAWDSVKQGALNYEDGQNVALHEFAHQLDTQDGSADGAPALESRSRYHAWAKVLSKSYAGLQSSSNSSRRNLASSKN